MMHDSDSRQSKPIFIFLILTFAFSSIFYYLIISAGTLAAGNGLYVLGLMWCPGIAAIITTLYLRRSLKSLGWKWGSTKYQIQSYMIPLLYAFVAYVIVWTLGFGKLNPETLQTQVAENLGIEGINAVLAFIIALVFLGIVGIIPSAIAALGEEIGWRGFLVPELFDTYGFTRTSFITGLIWGVWHLPVLLFADYNSGTPVWFAMICFMVLVVSISFIYTWLRVKSGSLWTAVLLHASHNLFIQSFFTPITEDTGNTAYFIDEFGVVLPILSIGLAFYYFKGRNELIPDVTHAS